MPRSLHADYTALLGADSVNLAFLLEAAFESQTLRLWTGYGDLSWNSVTWYGNGWFRGWDGPGESSDVKPVGMAVTLMGVPSAVVSLALGEVRQNKTGRLYMAFLDAAGAVIADPYLLYEGRFDTAEIHDGVQDSDVTLTWEQEFIELEKAPEFRFNDATQRGAFPGDKGMEYVADVAEWDGFWGVPETKAKRKRKRRKSQRNKRRK